MKLVENSGGPNTGKDPKPQEFFIIELENITAITNVQVYGTIDHDDTKKLNTENLFVMLLDENKNIVEITDRVCKHRAKQEMQEFLFDNTRDLLYRPKKIQIGHEMLEAEGTVFQGGSGFQRAILPSGSTAKMFN